MIMNRRLAAGLLAGAAVLPFLRPPGSGARAQTAPMATPTSPPPGPGTIAQRLAADTRFSRFSTLSHTAGLTGRYTGTAPYTVFAPTDAAFNSLPASLLQALTGTTGPAGAVDPRGSAVLTQHVAAQTFPFASFNGKVSEVTTVNGGKLRIDGTKSPMTVEVLPVAGVMSGPGGRAAGGLATIESEITASNGVIHVINGVLVP